VAIHISDEQIKSVKEIEGYFYNNDGYADVIIMKIDKLGNVVWAKSFGNPYEDDKGSIDGYNDLFVAKFTNDGNLIWAKIYRYE